MPGSVPAASSLCGHSAVGCLVVHRTLAPAGVTRAPTSSAGSRRRARSNSYADVVPTQEAVSADRHDAAVVEIAFTLMTSVLLVAGSGLATWLLLSALGQPTNERILEIVLLAGLVGRTAYVLRRFDRSQRRLLR